MDPAWMRPLSAATLLTYSVTPTLRDQSGRLVEAGCASPGAASARPVGQDHSARV